ncbi:MAG: TetR family transcriptional regulator [Butyricicoccus sp.]|nr:TetR family transcriptional regulator [Butyricicoccus sp.]
MPVDMKRMIAATFTQMAKEKHIDKITVKDLVEQCGISRQTFYYHFQDMLDVMEWTIRQALQCAVQDSLQAETPQKAIERFIRPAITHGPQLVQLLSSQRRDQVVGIFVDAMRSSIGQMLYSRQPDRAVRTQDLDVALTFYAYGITGVIVENCKKPNIPVEYLAEQIYRLFSAGWKESQ